jgi:hypothetical protein
MAHGSQIKDIFNFKLNKQEFPEFSKAEGGIRGVVKPGDVLFVPR